MTLVDKYDNTPLHYAAVEAREATLGALVADEKSKPILRGRNVDDLLPLHMAACAGDVSAVAVLLEADRTLVDLRVREEGTACHAAAEKGHTGVLSLLITSKADLEAHVSPETTRGRRYTSQPSTHRRIACRSFLRRAPIPWRHSPQTSCRSLRIIGCSPTI